MAASYATNSGQTRGSDRYTITDSYIASNATDKGDTSCPGDIAYLKSANAGEFCTSYNSYTAPTVSTATTVTPSPSTTVIPTTVVVDETSTQLQIISSTAFVTVTTGVATAFGKRAATTPTSAAAWGASRLSAACSALATGTVTNVATQTASALIVSTVTTVLTTTTHVVSTASTDIVGTSTTLVQASPTAVGPLDLTNTVVTNHDPANIVVSQATNLMEIDLNNAGGDTSTMISFPVIAEQSYDITFEYYIPTNNPTHHIYLETGDFSSFPFSALNGGYWTGQQGFPNGGNNGWSEPEYTCAKTRAEPQYAPAAGSWQQARIVLKSRQTQGYFRFDTSATGVTFVKWRNVYVTPFACT